MCQSFWPYRINMIGNGTMIMIECCRLESFKLGWTRSINKDESLDTRRDSFFLCISFCFLKALHLHSTTSTYGQAWLTSLRTSNSARQNRRAVMGFPVSLRDHCAKDEHYRTNIAVTLQDWGCRTNVAGLTLQNWHQISEHSSLHQNGNGIG